MNQPLSSLIDIEPDTRSTWQAELNLVLAQTPRGTVLRRCQHRGPLYVQKPFYPEGRELAHIYLLHPPGGMVSGDDLRIAIEAEPQAQTLITTPGAGRVYRARPDRTLQQQKVVLQVGAHSTLEWLPLENIIFPDACTDLSLSIELHPSASVIAWDITCLGLPASGQAFDRGAINQQLQVSRGGRLQLRERLTLNPAEDRILQSQAGLAGQAVNGLMLAGPFPREDDTTALLTALQQQCAACPSLAAVSVNGDFIQVRYLGACAEQARHLFCQCWTVIRPALIGRDACEPRIWAT